MRTPALCLASWSLGLKLLKLPLFFGDHVVVSTVQCYSGQQVVSQQQISAIRCEALFNFAIPVRPILPSENNPNVNITFTYTHQLQLT